MSNDVNKSNNINMFFKVEGNKNKVHTHDQINNSSKVIEKMSIDQGKEEDDDDDDDEAYKSAEEEIPNDQEEEEEEKKKVDERNNPSKQHKLTVEEEEGINKATQQNKSIKEENKPAEKVENKSTINENISNEKENNTTIKEQTTEEIATASSQSTPTVLTPKQGMEFDTLLECRQFCVDFSKQNGFLLVTHNSSHKKGYLIMECVYHRKYRNAKKKKTVTQEDEAAGGANKVVKKTRNRKSKRSGCNCRIVFNRRRKSQKFALTSMYLEHNHPLPAF